MTERADLAALAYLWDGSEPEWSLRELRRQERRLVIVFEASGATARDLASLREVFDEFRDRPAQELWEELSGNGRIAIERVYSPKDVERVVDAATARGLKVELSARESIGYVPVNTHTQSALLIEDDELAREVAERMLAAGVACEIADVD
jgi:hypothetical protein